MKPTDTSSESDTIENDVPEYEREKWRRLQFTEDREYELRLREIKLKERREKRSQLTNPLVLAIVAAALAALGNGVVAWVNAENQRIVEENRASLSREIESQKMESLVMIEFLKSSTSCEGVDKLNAALGVGLVPDSNRRAEIEQFILSVSQSNQCKTSSKSESPSTVEPIYVTRNTGWLGGGHNQPQQCRILRSVLESEYPDSSILLESSSEKSKKDWLGRVEYMYFCTFKVQ
ncbi:hypothetical protein I7103_004935 [Vibrio parahaemolyticus]|nr:hypothetical protein [Vibrio parahaemolyticus]